jgi:hypothetical protein
VDLPPPPGRGRERRRAAARSGERRKTQSVRRTGIEEGMVK